MALSQTATALIVVFAFFLTAVTVQLAYVLCWKRRFRRRSIAGTELDAFSSRGGDTAETPRPSKELLYFFLFCVENKQFRIGSATAPPLPVASPPDDDVAPKWSTRGETLLCGPSETLFTIAEDSTSETDHRTGEVEPRGSVSLDDHVKEPRGSVSLDDHVKESRGSLSMDDHVKEPLGSVSMDDNVKEPRGSVSVDDHVEEFDINDDEEVDSNEYNCEGTTPFSTPCGSPPFYTPSPSPARDDAK